MAKKIVLITGATSGIGEAIARLLAENNFNLIITGRRNERLQTLKEELEKKHGCKCLALNFDVRSLSATKMNLENLSDEWKEVDILINNAGLAVGLSTIQDGDTEDWERMIDTNIKGLLYVSKIIAKGMTERNRGHIINVSSIAGKETYPFGNVYCATKHAVQSLTKAMRIEMLQHNIKVSSISPGAVKTEFSLVRFKDDKVKADNVYNGFEPLLAQDIAETVLFMINRPAHVNIDDVLIMPTAQAFSRDFNKK